LQTCYRDKKELEIANDFTRVKFSSLSATPQSHYQPQNASILINLNLINIYSIPNRTYNLRPKFDIDPEMALDNGENVSLVTDLCLLNEM